MVKFLVTTKAFRASSKPSAKAQQIDPKNLLLSHANLRRLEAEAIQDSMLLISGRIKLERVAEGNSEPANSVRRSVYRLIKRRILIRSSPFLMPLFRPQLKEGDVTNVPLSHLRL